MSKSHVPGPDADSPSVSDRKQQETQGAGSTYTIHIQHAEGLAIGDHAKVVQAVPHSRQSAAEPPTISMTLLTEVVPTAYCYQLDARVFPLVTVTLDNTSPGCVDAVVRTTASIEGYSDPAIDTSSVTQGECVKVSLLPVLRSADVASLNELRPVTLHVVVDQLSPVSRSLHDATRRITLHARDTALLGARAPDGSIVDLADYLAAWVTPRHPEIEKLLRRAVEQHPQRQLVGYQGAATIEESAKVVRAQAHAIFLALKHEAHLVYVNSPLNMGKQPGQVTQRVRLPVEVLTAGGSANCIDGTVLFASLLELASLDPLLVIVPGHAFVGWRIWRGVEQYEFLETTMIASADFDAAHQVGKKQYEQALMKGWFAHGLFDPDGFARLVDVAACRGKGIVPLA